MTVEEFLAGVESRLTAATPGPWRVEECGGHPVMPHGEAFVPHWEIGPEFDDTADAYTAADAALIAAAPADLAKLTTALRSVLALHKPTSDLRGSAMWCQRDGAPSPCSTVAAITDAIQDTP